MPSKKKSSKPKSSAPGMSRGRRGMFLRIPVEHYEKLRRITAASQLKTGQRASVQGTVIALIAKAREP